jgi:hypothetical protein
MEALAHWPLFRHGERETYFITGCYKNHNETELVFLLYSNEEDVRVIGDEFCKYVITYSLVVGYIYLQF